MEAKRFITKEKSIPYKKPNKKIKKPMPLPFEISETDTDSDSTYSATSFCTDNTPIVDAME